MTHGRGSSHTHPLPAAHPSCPYRNEAVCRTTQHSTVSMTYWQTETGNREEYHDGTVSEVCSPSFLLRQDRFCDVVFLLCQSFPAARCLLIPPKTQTSHWKAPLQLCHPWLATTSACITSFRFQGHTMYHLGKKEQWTHQHCLTPQSKYPNIYVQCTHIMSMGNDTTYAHQCTPTYVVPRAWTVHASQHAETHNRAHTYPSTARHM